ncbi:polysaccharide deacetylase family protein [Actinomadura atramentaria]|uniref:polysaccharide deacetylase family protein n=1 Tax=Actinomadura atramentaria TaxID=1990 RepID=UPI000399E3AB|nr:polysaccharide deacetylase family protein [Actinomadura atramentaria]
MDCAHAKCVALTFDDGPGPYTAKLLDILAARHVRATFFLVGTNARAYPKLVRRERAEGHVVANHSWDHADLRRRSAAGVRSELARTQRAIERAGGGTPTLMRPPYGSTNGTVASVARGLGLAQILWTVDPLDWKDRNTALVTKRVVRGARPGYIILSHDIHRTTVNAVPAIIARLKAKGYVFVTVPELFSGHLKPGHKYFKRPR